MFPFDAIETGENRLTGVNIEVIGLQVGSVIASLAQNLKGNVHGKVG